MVNDFQCHTNHSQHFVARKNKTNKQTNTKPPAFTGIIVQF